MGQGEANVAGESEGVVANKFGHGQVGLSFLDPNKKRDKVYVPVRVRVRVRVSFFVLWGI